MESVSWKYVENVDVLMLQAAHFVCTVRMHWFAVGGNHTTQLKSHTATYTLIQFTFDGSHISTGKNGSTFKGLLGWHSCASSSKRMPSRYIYTFHIYSVQRHILQKSLTVNIAKQKKMKRKIWNAKTNKNVLNGI